MPHRAITSPAELEAFITFLRTMKLPFTAEWTQGRNRSLDQNDLQFKWATEAAYQRGDTDAETVQREWKLHHGVPILREDSADFRKVYDRSIKPMSYENKLLAMRYIPVSSIMKVRQMIRYLDTIQRECAEQGIVLTDPDPELASYQARYRNTVTKEAA